MNELEKWRTERKLSYQQAGLILGLNRQTIASLEKKPLNRTLSLLLKGIMWEENAEKMENIRVKQKELTDFLNLIATEGQKFLTNKSFS